MKYSLTQTETLANIPMFQITALRDIPMHGVKKGDIGGVVGSPDILSQSGECWVEEGCALLSGVSVVDDALIKNNSFLMSGFYAGDCVIDGCSFGHGSIQVKGGHHRILYYFYVETPFSFIDNNTLRVGVETFSNQNDVLDYLSGCGLTVAYDFCIDYLFQLWDDIKTDIDPNTQ